MKMTAQGSVDWQKLRYIYLWFIPYALWVVAIVQMTAPFFGQQVGNTIRFDGLHFTAWIITIIALMRAIGVWIDAVLDRMLCNRG